jgi:hypothetical protein
LFLNSIVDVDFDIKRNWIKRVEASVEAIIMGIDIVNFLFIILCFYVTLILILLKNW